MDMHISLFDGERICLTAIDHEKDPEIESRWTHDPEYLRMLSPEPAIPLSPGQVKKKYEKVEKESEESRRLFHFAIRTRARPDQEGAEVPERLIGFGEVYFIEWNHGAGMVRLAIGDPSDRSKGYGQEALRLLLRYAFSELNLFRLSAVIPEYNTVALHLFQEAGFVEEVRRREALHRDGRRWDLIHLGLLREEWRPA